MTKKIDNLYNSPMVKAALCGCFAVAISAAAPAYALEDDAQPARQSDQASGLTDSRAAAIIADLEANAGKSELKKGSLEDGSAHFQQLFSSWKDKEDAAAGLVYIPSRQPVDEMRITSQYGHREDPFRGRRANHKGIDIGGPVGTPIYATADGVVGRAQWLGGYGKYIEINHGGEIQTRYGHMSKLLVEPNQRVRKGQLIGLMGSTGRSTGSHLHYEVRIAGQSVNPTPFIECDEFEKNLMDHANVRLAIAENQNVQSERDETQDKAKPAKEQQARTGQQAKGGPEEE